MQANETNWGCQLGMGSFLNESRSWGEEGIQQSLGLDFLHDSWPVVEVYEKDKKRKR